MPAKSQGDLIREQGEDIIKLVERIDHIQKDLVRLETKFNEDYKLQLANDKQIAIIQRDIEKIQKKVEESRTRQWAVWQIVLTIVLSTFIPWFVTMFPKNLMPENLKSNQQPSVVEKK